MRELKPNDRVSISMDADGVAQVRMIRTDKMNALDGAQWNALVEAIDQLKATSGLRVVVLSGDGRAFCAGGTGFQPDSLKDQHDRNIGTGRRLLLVHRSSVCAGQRCVGCGVRLLQWPNAQDVIELPAVLHQSEHRDK